MIKRFPNAVRGALYAYDVKGFLHVLQSLIMSPGVVRNLRLRPQVFDLDLLLLRQHRAVLLHIIVERCELARALVCQHW